MFISKPSMSLRPDHIFVDSSLGRAIDLAILAQDRWLKDSAVTYLVNPHRGRWQVTMVFVWIKDPYRLLCRRIDSYGTEPKARMYAEMLRKNVQKDPRGILKTNPDDFHFCAN
jgi:hypothetical protein